MLDFRCWILPACLPSAGKPAGRDFGVKHQTGWTGIVARIMQLFATVSGEKITTQGKEAVYMVGAK
ncbi:MAG: hypothetical protein C5B52_12520 [Bacteroidetes bacterium]|nr:MAG: hypothetical protein C5B52_12520 [Bacteroidota bacterium]